jgi:hypothetical protein
MRWEQLQSLANKQNYKQAGRTPKAHLLNPNSEIGCLLTSTEHFRAGPVSGADTEL